MNPNFHTARRTARARALISAFPPSSSAFYVDDAAHRHKPAFTVAVISSPTTTPLTSLTIPTTTPHVAEEVAIALALTHQPSPDLILSVQKEQSKILLAALSPH